VGSLEPPRKSRKRAPARRTPIPRTDSIFNIIGLGKSSLPTSEEPTDVSSNVDKYLAEAIYAESHPPKVPRSRRHLGRTRP
jgi:hypothetical protein